MTTTISGLPLQSNQLRIFDMYDCHQLCVIAVTCCSACATQRILARAFAEPRRDLKEQNKPQDEDDRRVGGGSCENHAPTPTLEEVFNASVRVIGENSRGSTVKMVLPNGRVSVLKRFRSVTMAEREFGRRVERLAQVCNSSDYLVPISAYSYSKRIKLVVRDYYPMGSLADLLSGGRQGLTALTWPQRLTIIVSIARAIGFIHAQSPPSDVQTNMKMNVHGNIKSSNVMINVDLSARLSDYGFIQLVDCYVEDSDHRDRAGTGNSQNLRQESDIFSFGLVILDLLGVADPDPNNIVRIRIAKESIIQSKRMFFEFDAHGRDRKQALMVQEIALCCTDLLPEARPPVSQILLYLNRVLETST
ncbi:hypothetical protein HRI_005174400 [Hibiscus trionum]|uniref:Protein kinase domain-containing protein n=1 Tax=Hibiscus trionum TaxID=183268 RepID=A0A9W7JGT7_HIBTR|nr:hypothetical protein HRI_005174400 [Hibiscus trionum]